MGSTDPTAATAAEGPEEVGDVMDVEKLLAAIEETEQMAKHTEPGPWAAWPSDMPGEFVVARRNERTGKQDPDRVATTSGLYCAEQNARFIAHNDPAAVLRRCTEERKVVLAYKGVDMAAGEFGPVDLHPVDRGKWIGLRIAVNAIAAWYGLSVEEETTGE